jgi:hypothetical protein
MTDYKAKFGTCFLCSSMCLALLSAQNAKPVVPNQRMLFNLEVAIEAPVAIPEDVLKILRLSREVKTSRCVAEESNFGDFSGAWFEAAKVHLYSSDDSSLLVKAKNGCLMGANIGPFWIFQKSSKGHELLLTVNALAVEVLGTSTMGYRDIRATAVAGGEARSVFYKYNGKVYLKP